MMILVSQKRVNSFYSLNVDHHHLSEFFFIILFFTFLLHGQLMRPFLVNDSFSI